MSSLLELFKLCLFLFIFFISLFILFPLTADKKWIALLKLTVWKYFLPLTFFISKNRTKSIAVYEVGGWTAVNSFRPSQTRQITPHCVSIPVCVASVCTFKRKMKDEINTRQHKPRFQYIGCLFTDTVGKVPSVSENSNFLSDNLSAYLYISIRSGDA